VGGGDRERVAEAELVEVVHEVIDDLVIDLVDREEHGLAGRAQLLREVVIDRREARPSIDDEQQRVGLADRLERLAVDAGADHLALRLGIEAAGVDDAKVGAEVLGFAVAAIAREARRVVNERGAPADEAVEQGRLADVGPADNGDQRCSAHRPSPSPP
jgi:hypothetical protein